MRYHLAFLAFPFPLAGAGSGTGSGSAAFCTPNSLAMMTKEMPPTMLLAPRMMEVKRRNTPLGILGCSTCSSQRAHAALRLCNPA